MNFFFVIFYQVIIEKDEKEEYDGGSRGKIMPKGKRGPGWVSG